MREPRISAPLSAASLPPAPKSDPGAPLGARGFAVPASLSSGFAVEFALSLFELEAPAAMVRGPKGAQHGSKVDGRRFFAGEPKAATGAAGANKDEWAWHTQGGINAGVILLQPNENTFQAMRLELMSEHHPEHLPSAGPEQDYLTRFFASTPWHALDCKWNYQLHHVYVTDSGGFAVLYCF